MRNGCRWGAGLWKWLSTGVLGWLLAWLGLPGAQAATPDLALPPELAAWQAWVLHDHPDAHCPFLATGKQRVCAWPGKLTIVATEQGATFTFHIQTFAEATIALPGGANLWPLAVRDAKAQLVVADRDGRPVVRLAPGSHQLQGEFRWPTLPHSLPLPAQLGLVELNLNGRAITAPNRDSKGELWLREPETTAEPKATNSLTVRVFRHLDDNQPQVLTTEVQLQVSGEAREVVLGPALLPGFTPRELVSALPVKLEPDGNLRLRVQPGRHSLRLTAHSRETHNQFNLAEPTGEWPAQEVWVIAAQHALRTVQVSGAPLIDGSQTQLPDTWLNLPAYLLSQSSELLLAEQHRGDPKPARNELTLSKILWLDFDGQQLTAEDTIHGAMHRDWRLEVLPPYQLGRAELAGQAQLITRVDEARQAGFEVRTRTLDATAVSRLPRQPALPVSGWQQTFAEVATTLHLPPGWSALHIGGADRVNGSWVAAWNLWDVFLLLVTSVALWRAVSWPAGLLGLLTLLVVYHRDSAPVFAWLNLAAAFALLPFAKAQAARWLTAYLGASLVVVVVIALPFWVQEARMAIYPQLARAAAALPYPASSSVALSQAPQADSAAKQHVARSQMVEEVVISAVRKPAYQAAYHPDQKIQVGPGLPEWQWQTVGAHWSGPVLVEDTFTLYLAGPLATRLGHVLAMALVAALLALLVRHLLAARPLQHWPELPNLRHWPSAAGAALLVALTIGATPNQAHAQVVIDDALLQTLAQRLLAPPACLPACASLAHATLSTEGERLRIELGLHNEVALGLPLPGNLSQWWPARTEVDGAVTHALHSRDGELYVYLPPGRHRVLLEGTTRGLTQFSLAFQLPLHHVVHNTPGWQVSGVPSAQQTSRVLVFNREQQAADTAADARLTPTPMPPFVTVSRTLRLDLEWTVDTVITRVAPATGAIHLALPLLPGEAPSSGERTADGLLDLRFAPGERVLRVSSQLPVSPQIHLTYADNSPWAEVWRVQASPMWHATFSGPPPVAPQGDDVLPLWQPRPGESLMVEVARPTPVPGADYAIDAVSLTHTPGKRASTSTLAMTVRATFGATLELPLPPAASLTQVLINGRELPVTAPDQRLKLPIAPGEQELTIAWQTNIGAGFSTRTPTVELTNGATNIELTLNLPSDRWLLATGGPALGPAILFWGVLLVVLLAALALARSALTPLKVYEWVLLTLGVATINIWVLALVAVWFVSLQLRGQRHTPPTHPAFNAMQLLLMLLSVLALVSLAGSVPSSLLSNPDMYVTGARSSAYQLHWYQDRSLDDLPTAWAISLPIWAYRVLMLAWSLWLAFALMRWLKWGWQQLNAGAFWLEPAKKAPPTPAANKHTPPPAT